MTNFDFKRKGVTDFYPSRCDVFVHPSVFKRGLIPGALRLEKKTGMAVVLSAGQPAKLARREHV